MKVNVFQQLSMSQWVWLWSAYWRLWGVLLRIKLTQPSWLRHKIAVVSRQQAGNTSVHSENAGVYTQMHESVRLAARLHIMSANCLPRSLVLADMFIAKGYSAQVFIGVQKKEGRLASHAWVEVDGKMVAEPENVSDDFTRLQI